MSRRLWDITYNRPACPFCGGNSLAAFVGQPATPSGAQKEYEAYIHCLDCKTRFSWLVIGALESRIRELLEKIGKEDSHEAHTGAVGVF